METFLMILFITLCVASASMFIYLRITHVGLQGFWGKLLASALFVVGGFVALMLKQTASTYMYFILMGLFFSMVGDILLELKLVYRPHDSQYTSAGILAFSLSHVCFILGLSLYANPIKEVLVPVFVSIAIGAVLASIIVVNSANMGIRFGTHKAPAYCYTFIICITTVYAIALAILIPSLWIIASALALFLASNLLLMFIFWGGRNTRNMNIANLSTYYLAQILIMITLFIL